MWRGRVRTVALLAVGAVVLTGCELKDDGDNLENGKTLFVQKCASCHTLARANAKGLIGPNLDEAWQQAGKDGFGRSTFRGIVHRQILHPNNDPQVDPATGKTVLMPPNIVTGEDAEDVAAYVAQAAAAGGKDPGRLADVGNETSKAVAKESGGKLDIPADPNGATKYQFGSAEASAGQVTIESKNDSSTDHNIAIEGNGLDETGDIVKDGGVSSIDVDLKPGEYTFYCSVPGHREGGMEGKLTVK
jgi:plastocyanin